MSESDLFPDIDPVNPFPEDKKITRYMSLHAFIMLLTGKVFIPSVKKASASGNHLCNVFLFSKWLLCLTYWYQYVLLYAWYDSHYDHVADVIQTQTPINPGNSGGPLLDDDGKLIGINSFVNSSAQGLNYAVSVDEVTRVMKMTGDRLADGRRSRSAPTPAPSPESAKSRSRGDPPPTPTTRPGPTTTTSDGKTDRWGVDLTGTASRTSTWWTSDRDGKPDYALVDRNQDGKPEARIIYGDRVQGRVRRLGDRPKRGRQARRHRHGLRL